MRKLLLVLLLIVLVGVVGPSSAQDPPLQVLRTVQPIIGSDGSSGVASDDNLDEAIVELVEINAELDDDTPTRVYVEATTTGGCTMGVPQISTGAVMEYEIKATAGQLYGLWAYSLDATPVYVKIYNDTAANTDENDTPVGVFMVPSNSTAANGAGNNLVPFPGIEHSVAITARVVTGIAHTNTGALTANEVILTSCYQ